MTNGPNQGLDEEPRSLWRPIGFTLASLFLLSFTTCGGGFVLVNASKGLSGFLLLVGRIALVLLLLTLVFAAIYGIVRAIRGALRR